MSEIRRRAFFSLIGSSVAGWALAAANTGPKRVLLIRHAEEPAKQLSEHLNKRGYARAAALEKLFTGRFPKPDVIVASRSSKRSSRPVETVTPLAKAMGMPVDDRFFDSQYAALARELLSSPAFAGKIVLVCWHHETLPYLALALGVRDRRLQWPGSSYDRLWAITFEGGRAHLEESGQQLLPGDA